MKLIAVLSLLFSTVFFSGCMTGHGLRSDNSNSNQNQAHQKYNVPSSYQNPETPVFDGEPFDIPSAELSNSLPKNRNKIKIKNPIEVTKSIPSSDNIYYVTPYGEPLVKKWEDYFVNKGRRHMVRYLERLPRYEKLMKDILVSEGMPPELIYIALIESGFNSKAHSHASAVGYWQFIRGTGKGYGLKQNWLVDERRDPVYSTRAAARYFKALHKAFGSWHLAMCSYNAGENRVLRAVMNNVTRDFWDLHKKRQLPRETLNYVPKFIAAARIATNPTKYGFYGIQKNASFEYEEVTIKKGVSLSKLAKNLGVPTADIKKLNPIFKTDYAPVYRGSSIQLRIPVGTSNIAQAAVTKSISSRKYAVSEGSDFHRVRRGDSLYKIAKRYGTTVSKLKSLNGLYGRSIIRPGRKIKLPGSGKVARVSRGPSKAIPANGSYKVRRGDNLWSISKKFGLTIRSLKSLNNLRSSKLRVGQRLKVSISGGASIGAKSSVYYVKRGDNLTNISRKYGVRLTELLRKNRLKSSSKLLVGMRLVIPN